MSGTGAASPTTAREAFTVDRRRTARDAIAAALNANDGDLLLPAIAVEAASLEVFDRANSELAIAADAIADLPPSAGRDAAVSFVRLWTGEITENGIRAATGATMDLLDTAPFVAGALATSAAMMLLDTARWDHADRFADLAFTAMGLTPAHPPPVSGVAAGVETLWFTLMAAKVLTEWNTHSGSTAYDSLDISLAAVRQANRLQDCHAVAMVAMGHVQAGNGDLSGAAATVRRAVPLLPSHPASVRVGGQAFLATVLYRCGRWDEARQIVDAATAAATHTGTPWALDTTLALRALKATADGDTDHADLIIQVDAIQHIRWTREIDAILLHAQLLSGIQTGKPALMRDALDRGADPGYRLLYTSVEWAWWGVIADHLSGSPKTPLPPADYADTDPAGLVTAAIAADASADPVGTVTAIRRLLHALEDTSDPVLLAWTRAWAGERLHHYGRTREGDQALDDSFTQLDTIGARGLLATLTARTRIRPGPVTRLTSRQLLIAQLVAGGATSAEIADRLHLSRRTVDNHVAHILRKLHLTHRRELGPLLDRAHHKTANDGG